MKTHIVLAAAMLLSIIAPAQQTDLLKRFIADYSQRGVVSNNDPYSKQLGSPMPDFHFNDDLNLKSLKGKVIVLDFWATWCKGCMVISHDLDSLMVKDSRVYQNVRIIGVNCQEKKIDKGYNAREYWKTTGKGFPMADGAAADSCGASIHNGFPTVLLIDDNGIIRKRWDAATATTANAIRIAAWEYAVLPTLSQTPITRENALQLMEKRDWVSALYFFESLQDTYDTLSLPKLEAMMHVSETKAAAYAAALKEKLAGSPAYYQAMERIVGMIAQSDTHHAPLILLGINICTEIQYRPDLQKNYSFMENAAHLRWMNAALEKQKALQLAEQSYNMARQYGADTATLARLEKLAEAYRP